MVFVKPGPFLKSWTLGYDVAYAACFGSSGAVGVTESYSSEE